jgi:hypothetical protein
VDRVNYSSLCRDSTTDITAEAIQAIGDEKKVEIRRIRWLSKPSEKAYGSVTIFLAKHKDAESLLATGVMDFGSEMTYVKPYERRMLSMRCFKCQQYGQQEAGAPSISNSYGRSTQWIAMRRTLAILQANLGKRGISPRQSDEWRRIEGLQGAVHIRVVMLSGRQCQRGGTTLEARAMDTVQVFDQQCQRLLPYPVNDEMRSAATNPSALPRVDGSEIG